ncbi:MULTISPECIES: CHAT domain-containing protein [Calothrix]|uniref:CHAT domain-containing protein n=2 Tax=Calothrix TaxID=1186 RepID=A0ABR8AQB8_9CYAN|nr:MULTISPECIES: tetratricopeptide repeat protein [Calothrix]MBD2200861.1 CHAT domain-containing protein [Calothrix parietina FACHB-288]MBD2229894.1 CHAT domain-containing protein [Calothrix anomala FACHB-343]
MHSQKLALGIVAFVGKSRINSVGKFAVVLLLSLTLPVLVVAESREVALAKLNQVIAQTQPEEEQRQQKLELQELLQLSQLGVEHYNKKRYQEALEIFQKTLTIARKYQIDAAEVAILNKIGHTYLHLEKHSDALKYFQQALTVSKQMGDKVLEGKNLNDIGFFYGSLKQYTKALDFYQQALQVRKQNGDKAGEATTLSNISLSYYDLAQSSKAVEYMQQALAIRKQIGDRELERTILYNAGLLYDKLQQYTKALEFYQQVVAINRQIEDKAAEGSILGNIGNVYFSLGEYSKALECYQQAREIYKQFGKKAEEGIALSNIGAVYQVLGESAQSLEFLQKGLVLLEQIDEKNEKGKVINNIGVVYRKLGEYPKALELFQQALMIQKQVRDKLGEVPTLNGIGSVYNSLGQYSKALDFYQQALAICKQVGDRAGEGTTLSNIASVYDGLGQHLKALKLYKQALDIHREIGNKIEEGNTLDSMAGVASILELKAEALKLFQLALDIRKQIGDRLGEATTLNNIGSVYESSEEYAKALDFFQQAREKYRQISNKPGEGTTLHNIGSVYDSWGQYPKALEFYQQALIINKKLGSKDKEAASLSNIGYVYLRTGERAKAIENLSASVDALELLRLGLKDADKISIIDTQINVYKVLQQAYITQNQYEEALEISERGRARAFVELLAEKQQTQVQPKTTINQLKQIAKEQNATLVEYSIIDEEFKIEGKKQWLESQLYIWVVKPTGEVEFKSVDLRKQNTTIASLIPLFRKSINIASRNAGELIFKPGDRVRFKDDPSSAQPWEVISFDAKKQEIAVTHPTFAPGSTPTIRSIKEVDDSKQAPLQELHKLLIEPIAEFLPAKATDKIIFIPQAELFSVPFAALQDKKGKFLIEKHTILTSPSIQVLDLTRKQRQKLSSNVKEALVVGNPNPMPQPFGALKYATSEAQSIAKLYNTQAIIDNAATESAIVAKMPDARVIHLATHGDFNDTKGLESKIVLAPDAKNDGFLTAGEIFDLFGQPNSKTSLHAELVVLSACDTGRGEISGDGVIGLSRSLISAGVPSVIVSLWAVDDAETRFLMEEFYQQLKNNDKATALRNAMLATKEKNPNPQYWAAFTLIGEAN